MTTVTVGSLESGTSVQPYVGFMEPLSVKAAVQDQRARQGCACCAPTVVDVSATADLLDAAAIELGIGDADRLALLTAIDPDDCPGARDVMAAQVDSLLAVAGDRVVGNIGEAAASHASALGSLGMPAEVADRQRQTVAALDRLARLQAAAARLKAEPSDGSCTGDCVCAQAVVALTSSPAVPQSAVGLVLAPATAISCTLEGGIEAMQVRVGEWQDVVGRAIDRRTVPGGVTLLYGHDEQLGVELARLAAAEYACCSFFTFSLTVGPAGMAFTVTAPAEAGDVVTAMFGGYGALPEEAR